MKKALAIIAVLVVGIGWYFWSQPNWEPVPSHPSINAVAVEGIRIRVRLEESAKLQDVVHLFPFHGFRPEAKNFDEAREIYGDPDNITHKGDYDAAYEYWFAGDRVAFEGEETVNAISFCLTAYPGPLPLAAILPEEITSHIKEDNSETIVVISRPGRSWEMLIEIRGSRIESMTMPCSEKWIDRPNRD